MNCHYVTEKLTEPWHVRNKDVRYYDFPSGKICDGNTGTLFATTDANTAEIEQLMSKYVEAPLGKFKASLIDRFKPELVKNPIKDVADWAVYRALHLYHFVQVARFKKVHLEDGTEGSDLDAMLLKGEDYLNQLVLAHASDHKVLWIQLPDGFAFYFPETGFFQFPVEDPGCVTGWTYGYAVPLTPFVALASVGKSADEKLLFNQRNQLSAFSLGLNQNVTKALISPQALKAATDEEICAEIQRMRGAAVETAKAVGQIREQVVKMYESVGLKLGPKKPPGV